MAVMKAENGWNALIFTGNPGDSSERWELANVRRVPVIAWEIEANRLVVPITLMSFIARGDEFVIETPEKAVICYGRKNPDACLFRDSVEDYLRHMHGVLAQSPQEAVETETKH